VAPQARSTAVEIPDKLYFRIGEVARLTGVKAYVLRYWESEFGRLKPQKSPSGQRRYKRADVELILRIKNLLWQRKFTIAGARTALAKGEEKEAPPEVPIVSGEFIAQEAALIEKASKLEGQQTQLTARGTALDTREAELVGRESGLSDREAAVTERERVLQEREKNLEGRLRQAQEALAVRQADAQKSARASLQEQAHELDMLRTRSQLLENRADEAIAELDDVRIREARMTRAMAQVRRGIIEMRHRLHEAGKGESP
jgi:DNA-binding transcriptional MerR regulator